MKINELYAMEPKKVTRELGYLSGFRFDHIPELTNQFYVDSYWGLEEKNEKVEIRYHMDHCFDGRRVWVLASVWYEDKPVMVIQNAGREGDDHYARYVTDKDAYDSMISYIVSLLETDFKIEKDLYDADEDIKDVTHFYGHDLHTVEDVSW